MLAMNGRILCYPSTNTITKHWLFINETVESFTTYLLFLLYNQKIYINNLHFLKESLLLTVCLVIVLTFTFNAQMSFEATLLADKMRLLCIITH